MSEQRPGIRGALQESPPASREAEPDLLVDSAISHLDRLRRVLALEEWIRDAGDDPLLSGSCSRWRAEREELLAELNLESH